MYQSEQIDQLATALAKAQGEFTPAIKDANNPFYKSKYANLLSIDKACREPLSKNGLSTSHTVKKDENGQWIVQTILMHNSGQWISSDMPILTMKPDIQAFGSSLTYAKRYSLSALVGVVTDEDDDGEASMNRDAPQRKEAPKKQDVKRVYINDTQAHELTRLLSKCDEETQENVWKFLGDQNINDFAEMPEGLYEKVKARIESKLKAVPNGK